MPSLPLYALRRSEVFEALETSPAGLSGREVEQRVDLYGRNILEESQPRPAWRRLLQYMIHPMALLLWLAGLAAMLVGRLELGVIIWMVVLVNASFSYWRENRAVKAVAVLKELLPVYTRVIREGKEMKVPASEIVPGDLLSLAEGDNVPADARLVEAYGLRTNNSTLTGETLPAARNQDASLRSDVSELEQPNLVFAGTSVVSGTGKAVVYATGMLTQFGRIAHLTQTMRESPSLLQLQMEKISRYFSVAAVILALVVFAVAILDVGFVPHEAFLLAVGILVAIIPEGLAPTVTLTLAMAVQRLAQKGVLVKKLSVVETLGLTSVICTDKSGTMTQNQMTVRRLWVAGVRLDITGVGYNPEGEIAPVEYSKQGVKPVDLEELCKAAMLCNNSRLTPPTPEQPRWTCLGDQTEAALRVLAMKGGLKERELAQAYPRVHELPFDARRKRMATIHTWQEGRLAFVKGAPREVLQLCTSIQKEGEIVALDEQTRAAILATNDDFARSALRVLALASRTLPERSGAYSPENVEQGLTFLGLAGMMDPPRPEVAQAMQVFRSAGIRMVMVTGDYGLTAESVARRVGMLSGSSPRILTGADLEGMSDQELQALLDEEVIYSRMAPEHKLRLVEAFQAHGEVVAVVGDGVNDTPALRKSDVGIAMGITGTDVAKEAADVILVEDNFGSVVDAIREGRAVYDNLRKFITYILASNVPEVLPFILTDLLRLPLALTVVQILAIDMGTDLLPSLALGIEKPEPTVMGRPPRRRSQSLLDGKLLLRSMAWLGGIETMLCYLGFFLTYQLAGYSIIIGGPAAVAAAPRTVYLLATTVFFAGVVACQAGNVLACRSETNGARRLGVFSNPYLLMGIVCEVVLIVITIYIPPVASKFDHLPLPLFYWVGLSLFAPILYALEKGRKFLVYRLTHKSVHWELPRGSPDFRV
jgi:potassium/sodium efflux P-type ATPase